MSSASNSCPIAKTAFCSKMGAEALVTAGITFAWYSMPDVVRSRVVRVVGKSALAAGGLVYFLGRLPEEDWQDVRAGMREFSSVGAKYLAAIAAGAVVFSVLGERWLFRRGEKRRRGGKKLPHTRQALALAGLGFLVASVPDECLASQCGCNVSCEEA